MLDKSKVLDYRKSHSREDTAKKFGVTPARISQITAEASRKVSGNPSSPRALVPSNGVSFTPSEPKQETKAISGDNSITITAAPIQPEAQELLGVANQSGDSGAGEGSETSGSSPEPQAEGKRSVDISDIALVFGGIVSGALDKRGLSPLTPEELANIRAKAAAASAYTPKVDPRAASFAELGMAYVAPIVKRAVTERNKLKPRPQTVEESQAAVDAMSSPPPSTGLFDPQKAAAVASNDGAFKYEDPPTDSNLSMDEKIKRANAIRDSLVSGEAGA